MDKITTVVFDMDGTLLNTLDDITDSVNVILGRHDLPLRTIDEIRHMVGNGASYLMERAIASGKEHPEFDIILKEYQSYYEEHCNIKTGPYKHIPELLKGLNERGYKLAIVSNKPMGAVKELTKIYFGDYVSVAIGVTETMRRKPYPDEVFAAMDELGSTKEESIYVGDSEVDHKTAMNSGLRCISCLWGFRTKEELLNAGASGNIFVSDPLEILDLLQK
ncbi:HAD family hydrolase [Butyrivibrio sp. CB08]|uniref:HAD family hydrolase n=1 Tax=Butyrivibrio sp. CB08 TaxID=2364879 RepID=UPI000EA86075|nr:HAD family hydrolase [Butyrivibrio sp. CB08]RKM61176.1 HAD family hydrolase [Butyrivibrio sp. CB08]